jgi:nucleoside-diphosphate-sugar epimerase
VNGFTGGYVRRELEKLGFSVWGTVLENRGETNEIQADLASPESLELALGAVNPNVVVHLAGISSVMHQKPSEIYKTNVIGTRNLLSSILNLDLALDTVILASSANVYGKSSTDPLQETHKAAPENDYAASKIGMEAVANAWSSKIPITITRPFNYTGVGQSESFLVPKIVSHFRTRKKVIELGNIEVYRDFSDVRSIAWQYANLAKRPAPGEIFNLCSGRPRSIKEILSTLENLTGHTLEVQVDSRLVRDNEVLRLVGDNSKIRSFIGVPPEISFESTLEWMLEGP